MLIISQLVVTSVKDYLKKLKRSENESIFPGSEHTGMPISEPPRIRSPMSPRAATHSEYQPSVITLFHKLFCADEPPTRNGLQRKHRTH